MFNDFPLENMTKSEPSEFTANYRQKVPDRDCSVDTEDTCNETEENSSKTIMRCRSYNHFKDFPLRRHTLFYIAFATTVILSLLIVTSDVIPFFSCATSGYLPIYTLTIDDKSFAAKQILSSLQEGLKMISYVAKDLSVTLNNNDLRDSKIDYMDVIDTFSNHNEYKFSFGGYCRMNSVTGVESCSDCNGIDIFSCLIKDIGLQLGSISKVEDPKVIGTSFVITYSSSLSSLETLYRRGKLNEPGFEELDIDRLSLVHGLKMAHYFDKYMRYFLLWNTVLGILVSSSIIYVFLQVLLLRKSPTLTQLRSLPFNMTFLLVLSTASLVFHIFFVAALDFYYMSLEQVLHKYEIAAISRGSGHALFVVSTLFIASITLFLLALCYKRRYFSIDW